MSFSRARLKARPAPALERSGGDPTSAFLSSCYKSSGPLLYFAVPKFKRFWCVSEAIANIADFIQIMTLVAGQNANRIRNTNFAEKSSQRPFLKSRSLKSSVKISLRLLPRSYVRN